MYSVLLVDDEESMLEILKNTIQWQEMGVGTVLSSRSAQNALEIMKRHRTDLLITDIKMPGMDGIELIRQAKSHYPDIRCILLSAYQEFEYARSAIRLGAENYLLKPLIKDEMEQTIQNALDNLYAKRQIGESLLWENILRRWAGGTISGEELGERAVALGLNLYLKAYCAVCFAKRSAENVQEFYAFCVDELKKQLEVYPFWDERGRYVLIVGGKELEEERLGQSLIRLVCQRGMEHVVRISVGTIVQNADLLPLSYQAAYDCMEMSDLNQKDVLLRNEYAGGKRETDWLIEELRFLLYVRDIRTRENSFRYLCRKLYRGMENGEETDKAAVRLLGICMEVFATEFPLRGDLRDRIFRPRRKFEKRQTEKEFTETLLEIFGDACRVFWDCFSELSPIVQLAVEYVRDGVMEGKGGSIKEFCAKNGMNPAYLGHIYKKETGYFFNEYLNQCRINRSVILLRNPNSKIKDIAEKVGFTSVSYYVKCFREKKGISPEKYRIEDASLSGMNGGT